MATHPGLKPCVDEASGRDRADAMRGNSGRSSMHHETFFAFSAETQKFHPQTLTLLALSAAALVYPDPLIPSTHDPDPLIPSTHDPDLPMTLIP